MMEAYLHESCIYYTLYIVGVGLNTPQASPVLMSNKFAMNWIDAVLFRVNLGPQNPVVLNGACGREADGQIIAGGKKWMCMG